MPTDRNLVLIEILKLISETEEFKEGINHFELSRLKTDRYISRVTHSTNVNTINQYWKKLIWENFILSCFKKQEITLQRMSEFGLFDKKKCEDIIKKYNKMV